MAVLKKLAKKTGGTISGLVRKAVDEFVKKRRG